jgi:hypothetical protein
MSAERSEAKQTAASEAEPHWQVFSIRGAASLTDMSSATAAWRDGWRRVVRAPGVFLGYFAVLTLLTAPAAWMVRDALVHAFGDSTIASRLAAGFDLQWYREAVGEAEGLLGELTPSVIGFAAVLRNASDLVSGDFGSSSFLIVLAWFVVGTALSGGVIDRYARQRPLRVAGFVAACGRTMFRLLRLNALVLLLYAVVLGTGRSIAAPAIAALIRDQTSERMVFLWYALSLAAAALLVALITVVADCARIRLVVEDRRSALFALIAGWRFARRTGSALALLYAMLIGTLLACVLVYYLAAPGANLSGIAIWVGFAVSQAYVAARVLIKLLTYAAATSLFQSQLAHAEYIAAPAPIWPESPIVETLGAPGLEPTRPAGSPDRESAH